MKMNNKHQKINKASWLNLHYWIVDKNVRKLIYSKLDDFDKQLVHVAHTGLGLCVLYRRKDFAKHCIKYGYMNLYQHNILNRTYKDYVMLYTFVHKLNGHDEQLDVCCMKDKYEMAVLAVKYNHLEVLKAVIPYVRSDWVSSKNPRGNGLKISPLAIKHGHLNIVQWLCNHGYMDKDDVCKTAAKFGHLHIIEWAHQNQFPWSELCCIHAALNDHLHVLLYLCLNKCPWSRDICKYLHWTGKDHNVIMQWIHNNELACDCIKK